jgi:hypothetical protein
MQQLFEKARVTLDGARIWVALLGLAVASAGLVDRFLWNLPIAMPEGQALFWYVACAAIACWGCR